MDSGKKFEALVDKWVADTEKNIMAVIKNSIEDLVDEASVPVKSGGKMPVDTGFLRLSGTGAVNQMPEGEGRGRNRNLGEIGVIYQSNPTGAIKPMLIKFEMGDTFYFGWTAIYAPLMNIKYGFLDSAVQNWSDIVANNVRKLKG